MRVAIIQERVDTRRGGAETSTLEMARRLAELDARVTVVCADDEPAGKPGSSSSIDEAGSHVRIERIPAVGPSKLRRTIAYVRGADSYCREQRFQIVHAITPCFSANVYQPRSGLYRESLRQSTAMYANPASRALRRWLRRFNYRQRFLMLAERALLSDTQPPWIASVSRYVLEQVRRCFPTFPLERAPIVLNGVDIQPGTADEQARWRRLVREELKIGDATPLVLFVGHNFKLKGLRELIDAAAWDRANCTPQRPPWAIAVVGHGDARRYRLQAKRRGLANAVSFLGARDEVRPLYAAADALAHPTWFDPCSRVVLEALACGLPVVTTQFNGAADAIDDGRTGVVIETPRDVGALAHGIAAALDGRMRAQLAAGAIALRERLSMARHARELRELYERVFREY